MLHKFDTEQLVKHAKSGFMTTLIIGKRATGKTTFIKDLLNKINSNELTVFASKDISEYDKYIGDKHTQLDYNILEQIIKNQVMKSDIKLLIHHILLLLMIIILIIKIELLVNYYIMVVIII